MPTATSRRAPPPQKLLTERRTLCEERLKLEHKTADDDARKAAIDARLKQIATEIGESFKETFASGDYVSVSGAVAAEFKGDVPVVQTEAWQALKPAEQKAHIKSGLILMESQWGRASNGRVTPKIFPKAN